MAYSVNDIIKEVIRREGGYVDDPADGGGATNHGISLKYIRGIGLDVNEDGIIDEADIAEVTEKQAALLYKQDFYYKYGYDNLDKNFRAIMLDMAVMSGGARASTILQETLNDLESDPELKEDGLIGPRTVKALNYCIKVYGVPSVMNALTIKRIEFYRAICDRRPSQLRFLAGWTNRAQEFLIATV
jgi:lysozyme family protein